MRNRKIFTLFLAVFLGFLGFIQTYLYSAPLEVAVSKNISILFIDQYSPSKNETIQDLLALQQSLIIPVQLPVPEENAKNGFLLIPMTPQYVNDLLEHKQGVIVAAYQEQSLLGYVLLVDVSEFQELYQNENSGYIEAAIDLSTLETLLSQPNVGYIEQIGIKPGYSKMGIGTQLINASKKLKPSGLVANVFLKPLTNEASLQFFSKQDFKKSAVLHLCPRESFPHPHQTQVFSWNLDLPFCCFLGEKNPKLSR